MKAISLATAGGGQSRPILFGANQVGDALVATGVMSLAGASAALVTPLLPVRVAGVEVREALHRFHVEVQPPSIEAGLITLNRIGEPLATLAMQWLVAPETHEANASSPPPLTELDSTTTQRFVMRDASIRFRDRSASGVRFFGAGRTFPVAVEGAKRLLFAGVAVVLEGLGNLRGLRGSVTVVGEIRSRAIASLVLTGRFDPAGPIESAGSLLPMIDSTGQGPDAAVFTLHGTSPGEGGGEEIDEAISSLIVENDVAHGTRPRAFVGMGAAVGGATGRIPMDAPDRRPAVYLQGARRDLTFIDANGRLVASLTAEVLEGTSFPDASVGDGAARVLAYGGITGATGALETAAGVLTLDAAVAGGATTSLYTLWIVDPSHQFRAAMPAPPLHPDETQPASAAQFNFVEGSAGSMLPADVQVIARVENALAEGNDLRAWFSRRAQDAEFAERFKLADADDDGGSKHFGFYDLAPVGSFDVPVMGVVHEASFDRLKTAASDAIRAQLREFVLGHFLSTVRPPGREGYRQLYYKIAGTGQVGKFAKHERAAVQDVRCLGTRFDWITLKTDTFPLNVRFSPFGRRAPSLPVPIEESGFVVAGPSFIVNTDRPRPGVVAEYGLGYALVAAPSSSATFRTGVQTFDFALMDDGEIRSRAVFVSNRPAALAPMDLDPIRWGVGLADLATFRMASWLMGPLLAVVDRLPLRARNVDPFAAYIRVANALTGGLAERDFGISKEAVEQRMLCEHFKQQRELLLGALQVWRTVPDWTAPATAPARSDVGKVW